MQNKMPRALSLRVLETKHPSFCLEEMQDLEALYRGGRAVTDSKITERIFPKHRREHADVYEERKRRAFYLPYAGAVIDLIVAAVFREPLRLEMTGDDAPPTDYEGYRDNIARPGSERVSPSKLMRELLTCALIKRRAYTLVDLPRISGNFQTLADQIQAGALSAYAIPVDPETVTDWEEDDAGGLEWAVIRSESRRRQSPSSARNATLHEWTFYTRDSWHRYALSVPDGVTPAPDHEVPMVDEGAHTFGEVPLLRMTLPDGLWLMSKIESVVKEMFNKISALSWAQFQHLFPERYEFKGGDNACAPEYVNGELVEHTAALTQTHGMGYTQTRLSSDRVEFVGPDTSSFDHAIAYFKMLRDELHRVVHQAAQSVENSAASMRRSAESKEMDSVSQGVVAEALAKIVREHAKQVFRLIAVARGDREISEQWEIAGLDAFDVVNEQALVETAMSVATIDLQSPTAKRLWLMHVIRSILPAAYTTPELMVKIEAELEKNVESEPADRVPASAAPEDSEAEADDDQDAA